MKTIKLLIAAAGLTASVITADAQNLAGPFNQLATGTEYNSAIGLRAGETSGLTFKTFIKPQNALEIIVGTWNHGLSFTLLYEHYSPAFKVAGLNWYYGGGGHVAIKNKYYLRYYEFGRYYYYQESRVGLGIDGVAGIEYKIPTTPLAVNLEVKPYIEFISNSGIWSSVDPGLGIKLTF